MIRSPLFGEDSELHLKNMGMRGLDLTRDDVRDVTHLSMTSTNNAWQPSSSPTSSSPPRNNMAHWSERFHSNSGGPTAGLPDDGSFRGFSTPGGPISANWQLQAPGCPLPVSSSTPVTGARTSPIPSAPGTMAPTLPSSAVPHMLPMGQGLPPLPQIYSPFFDQMECRDANSSAAAAAVLGWPYSQLYYSYDPMIGQVGGYSTDIAAGRRKNATRETTSTLKAWLKEHKKNPYPTKGEKIMLAIISKMTLTQVSTWFANARRRLKKENKMMWDSSNNNNNGNSHAQPAGATDDSDADDRSSEKSNSAPVTGFGKAEESRLGGHAVQPGTESTKNGQLQRPKDRVSSATVTMKNGMNGETKPKIWSIVDTVRNPPEAAIPSSSSTPNGGARATLRRPRDELDTLDDDKASPVKKARFEVDLLSEVAGAGAVTASSLQHHHRVSSTNDKTSSPAGMESAGLVVGDETNRCDNMPSTSS